jgi:hypothetical protein
MIDTMYHVVPTLFTRSSLAPVCAQVPRRVGYCTGCLLAAQAAAPDPGAPRPPGAAPAGLPPAQGPGHVLAANNLHASIQSQGTGTPPLSRVPLLLPCAEGGAGLEVFPGQPPRLSTEGLRSAHPLERSAWLSPSGLAAPDAAAAAASSPTPASARTAGGDSQTGAAAAAESEDGEAAEEEGEERRGDGSEGRRRARLALLLAAARAGGLSARAAAHPLALYGSTTGDAEPKSIVVPRQVGLQVAPACLAPHERTTRS